MTPISFQLTRLIPKQPASISVEISDTARWSEFAGYAFVPGIQRAEYEVRTEQMVGSRVRVHNNDGSQHVEEITVWEPERRIVMRLHGFSPPLNRLATHFVEEWNFVAQSGVTRVTRKFQMHPTRAITRPLLWFISLFFRRAVSAHLNDMAR